MTNRYEISDVVTLMAEIKKEGIGLFYDSYNDWFVDKDGKPHKLYDYDTRSLVHRLAKEEKTTLR